MNEPGVGRQRRQSPLRVLTILWRKDVAKPVGYAVCVAVLAFVGTAIVRLDRKPAALTAQAAATPHIAPMIAPPPAPRAPAIATITLDPIIIVAVRGETTPLQTSSPEPTGSQEALPPPAPVELEGTSPDGQRSRR